MKRNDEAPPGLPEQGSVALRFDPQAHPRDDPIHPLDLTSRERPVEAHRDLAGHFRCVNQDRDFLRDLTIRVLEPSGDGPTVPITTLGRQPNFERWKHPSMTTGGIAPARCPSALPAVKSPIKLPSCTPW